MVKKRRELRLSIPLRYFAYTFERTGTRCVGSVSGPRFARPCSPWPGPFPPRAPPTCSVRLCSPASSVPWACPTSLDRASPAYTVGLPGAARPAIRGGRSRDLPCLVQEGSARAGGLGPRRVGSRLAITATPVLPSASRNSVGTPVVLISWLDGPPVCAPVNASPSA